MTRQDSISLCHHFIGSRGRNNHFVGGNRFKAELKIDERGYYMRDENTNIAWRNDNSIKRVRFLCYKIIDEKKINSCHFRKCCWL
jgi:hypothetical protein